VLCWDGDDDDDDDDDGGGGGDGKCNDSDLQHRLQPTQLTRRPQCVKP